MAMHDHELVMVTPDDKKRYAPVSADALATIALNHAGDGGMTEAGTAEAMVWQAEVYALKPGEMLKIPGNHRCEFYIMRPPLVQ